MKYLNLIIFFFYILSANAQGSIDQNSMELKSKFVKYFSSENNSFLDYQPTDLDFTISNEINDKQLNAKIVYLRQKINEIEVYNAIATFIVKDDLIHNTSNRFVKNCLRSIKNQSINIQPIDVYKNVVKQLNIENNSELTLIDKVSENLQIFQLADNNKLKFQLMYLPINNKLILIWNFSVKDVKNNHWWDICMDVNSGEIVRKYDWVLSCTFSNGHNLCTEDNENNSADTLLKVQSSSENSNSVKRGNSATYNVFPLPYESPLFTSRKLISNPYGTDYSPSGWQDEAGINGNEDKITKGNNVYAYEDANADDLPGYSPQCNDLHEFNFGFDTLHSPIENQDASLTQLFYINNMIHDIAYSYGFDEESGNFQTSNFNKNGQGNDAVFAEAQDGSGLNNANFATPPDGQNPRMQMYLFQNVVPAKILNVTYPNQQKTGFEGLLANFGPQSFSPILDKELILFNDATAPDSNDACELPINGKIFKDKIVLLNRGICNFIDKVKKAQDFGAVAVIVVNNTISPSVITMGGVGSTLIDSIYIPSLMISMDDGIALKNGISKNKILATIDLSTLSQVRDSDFDNGIILHEYTHGISNRLTGGPSNTSCLYNAEQMGEGWSDYVALMLTLRKHDFVKDNRVMGLYAISEDTSGLGIRPAPYSTNFNVNGYTYGDINDSIKIAEAHGIGFVWATMLWDMTAKLVEIHGFDEDVVNGKGGNNIALKLVIYAMKLQPCSPGFVDARDAILLADELLYNSENKYTIWCAFAKRGLGYSASQGSSDNRVDQVEAFDFPPNIEVNVTSCGPYTWPLSKVTYNKTGVYSFSNTSNCNFNTKLNLTILNEIDTSVTRTEGGLLKANLSQVKYQWLDCNNKYKILDYETRQILKPTKNGNYAVKIDNNACVDTSTCFLIKTLNVEEQSIFDKLSIFPNPTNGEVHIVLNQTVEMFDVKFIDITGKIIYTTNLLNTANCIINPNLEKGTYEVELTDGKGNYYRQKLVVIF